MYSKYGEPPPVGDSGDGDMGRDMPGVAPAVAAARYADG